MRAVEVEVADGTSLSVAATGDGADVVVLSGGPGCVHYLAEEHLAPRGVRSWFPSPRGVPPSSGGPHDVAQAIADLEDLRQRLGIEAWVVLGHSWGSDLAVRYALDHPESVQAVIGVAGHGLQRDSSWSEAYRAGLATQKDPVEIDWVPDVHASLFGSFKQWIHEPHLYRRIADSLVPMQFIAAGLDIRPHWPLQQVAALAPGGSFTVVEGVVHDFWATTPEVWVQVTTEACATALRGSPGQD